MLISIWILGYEELEIQGEKDPGKGTLKEDTLQEGKASKGNGGKMGNRFVMDVEKQATSERIAEPNKEERIKLINKIFRGTSKTSNMLKEKNKQNNYYYHKQKICKKLVDY